MGTFDQNLRWRDRYSLDEWSVTHPRLAPQSMKVDSLRTNAVLTFSTTQRVAADCSSLSIVWVSIHAVSVCSLMRRVLCPWHGGDAWMMSNPDRSKVVASAWMKR